MVDCSGFTIEVDGEDDGVCGDGGMGDTVYK